MGGPLGAIIGRYPSAAGGDEQLGGGASGGIIRHDRRCRDIAFLVLFAAFWVAMIVNSSFGFNQGNPLRSARFAPHPSPSLSGSALALPSWA
jgi:choline transporter-like protein 2/4/5